jgi:acylglycerol lipase
MTAARLILAACALLVSSCATFGPRAKPALHPNGLWNSFDGKTMPWRSWLPPSGQPVRAVVITIHGLSGAASDFWLLGERLPRTGCAVYGYELRGQGNDPDRSQRGDIMRAREWLRDLAQFHELVKARHPRAPIIWYGESLGSLIALHTADRAQRLAKPDAIVLAAPAAGLRIEPSELERFLIKTSSHVLPRVRVTLGDLAGVEEDKLRVTSQSTHGEQMQVTPHHVSAFTLRLLREIGNLIDSNSRAAQRLEMPVLMLASPHDIVASPEQVQQLFREIRSPRKRLLWYPRSYHLLLHDVEREDVVDDLQRWIQRTAFR